MFAWGNPHYFSPTAKLCYGALKAQISSDAIRCSFDIRFRRVLVQIPPGGFRWGSGGFCAAPKGSGADTLWGSGGFRCRYLVRLRKFPVQVLCEVPEGYGADCLHDDKTGVFNSMWFYLILQFQYAQRIADIWFQSILVCYLTQQGCLHGLKYAVGSQPWSTGWQTSLETR